MSARIWRIHEIRKRVMCNLTEEGLRAGADNIDWNKNTEDLDISTEHLEATIWYVIDKVAPVKIVKKIQDT